MHDISLSFHAPFPHPLVQRLIAAVGPRGRVTSDRAPTQGDTPCAITVQLAHDLSPEAHMTRLIDAIMRLTAQGPSAQPSHPTSVAARTLMLSGTSIDLRTGEVSRQGASCRLTPLELAALQRLWLAHGEFVSRSVLEREVWGYAPGTRTRTVLSTIHRMRQKIENDPRLPRHVQSDHSRGYRLVTDGL